MYKDNKNTKKGQKSKKTTPFSYENIRNTVHENLLKEEHELNEKKKEFGYGYTTWEQLLELAIEDLDQEKAEKIILLKEYYKLFKYKNSHLKVQYILNLQNFQKLWTVQKNYYLNNKIIYSKDQEN